MSRVIQAEELELRPGGTIKFEGADHGAEASFFYVKSEPGAESSPHQHPYAEIWIVVRGEVRFTVGGDSFVASAGQVIVAPAEVPHAYRNVGAERLELIGIHPSPRVVQREAGEP